MHPVIKIHIVKWIIDHLILVRSHGQPGLQKSSRWRSESWSKERGGLFFPLDILVDERSFSNRSPTSSGRIRFPSSSRRRGDATLDWENSETMESREEETCAVGKTASVLEVRLNGSVPPTVGTDFVYRPNGFYLPSLAAPVAWVSRFGIDFCSQWSLFHVYLCRSHVCQCCYQKSVHVPMCVPFSGNWNAINGSCEGCCVPQGECVLYSICSSTTSK